MNDYCKPSYMRWFYSPGSFWGNICATVYWLRHCWQRAFRGYADCDWWNMNGYLVSIILPMLRELKKYQHGYPGHGQASTPEKWDAILDRIIDGFEAGDRVIEDGYFKKANDDILTRKPTSEEVKGWVESSRVDQKIFKDSMKLFSKWFFALWD